MVGTIVDNDNYNITILSGELVKVIPMTNINDIRLDDQIEFENVQSSTSNCKKNKSG